MSSDVLVKIQPTPNPYAWKFVLDRPVLLEGKETFNNVEEAGSNRLASDLMAVEGVKQVHFFSNVITVTSRFDYEFEHMREPLLSVIQTRLPVHDPSITKEIIKKQNRSNLSPEMQTIEEVLDRTIRPGLQGDGGDIEVIKYEENKLYVHYQGACGTCPSATSGTLMAIEGILRDEFNPQVEVIPL